MKDTQEATVVQVYQAERETKGVAASIVATASKTDLEPSFVRKLLGFSESIERRMKLGDLIEGAQYL